MSKTKAAAIKDTKKVEIKSEVVDALNVLGVIEQIDLVAQKEFSAEVKAKKAKLTLEDYIKRLAIVENSLLAVDPATKEAAHLRMKRTDLNRIIKRWGHAMPKRINPKQPKLKNFIKALPKVNMIDIIIERVVEKLYKDIKNQIE